MTDLRNHRILLCLLAGATAITSPAIANATTLQAIPTTIKYEMAQPVQHWAPSGVSVTLYQRAIDKALADAPTLVGPVFSDYGLQKQFAASSTSILGCNFSYALGVENGQFTVNIAAPTVMAMKIHDGDTLELDFDIDASGSVQPYATADLCDLWSPSAAPTVSANGIYGSMTFTLSVQDHQVALTNAIIDAHFHNIYIDLGPISWLLEHLDLQDAFDSWIQGIVEGVANDQASKILPGMVTTMLQNKLDLSQSVQAFTLSAQPTAMATAEAQSLTATIDASIEATIPVACSGDNCIEPIWPPTYGKPDPYDEQADAAIAIGMSAFNQALFAAWRSGTLAYHQELDAATVVGAIFPGLKIDGTAIVDVSTGEAPTASLPDPITQPTVSDPNLHAADIKAHVHIVPATAGALPLDIYVTTEFSATGIIEISAPEINGVPNPTGNQIQFHATNFALGTTTMQYGPSSGLLTGTERDALLNQLIIPQYQAKVGVLPLSSSILNFNIPASTPPRRAALHILRKARALDAIAVYVRFDVSPAGDNTPPAITVTSVDGRTPDVATRDVLVGTHDPIATYSGKDDFSEYNDYITYETSTDDANWTDRSLVRSIKLLNLNEGINYLYVRGHDFANNLSLDPKIGAPLASARLIVDTIAPTTSIVSAPATYLNVQQASISYTGADAGSGVQDYMLTVDGQVAAQPQTVTSHTFTSLSEGVHTIGVFARDRLLHVDPVGMKARFTVDLTAPKTALAGSRTGYVKPSNARFAMSASDNLSPLNLITYSYKLDGPSCAKPFGSFASDSSADVTSCALADGAYTLTARAKDAAGNIDLISATTDFKVDGASPVLTLLDKPEPRSHAKQLDFLVAATDNFTAPTDIQYSYRLVGETNDYSTPTLTPHIVLDNVPSGDYEFQVTATDLAQNQSPQIAYKFSLDNVAPTTQLEQPMPQWTNAVQVPVALAGKDDRSQPTALTYSVSIDSGAAQTLTPPVSLDTLSEGEHTLKAYAIDEFGNQDPVGVVTTFTVDRTPPSTTVIGATNNVGVGTYHPKVSGTDNLTPQDQLRYSYRLTKAGLPTPEWSAPKLAGDFSVGLHETGLVTIEIAAIDNAGNVDPQPYALNANVHPATGCDCSATSGSPQDLMPFAAAAMFFLMRRRRSVKKVTSTL